MFYICSKHFIVNVCMSKSLLFTGVGFERLSFRKRLFSSGSTYKLRTTYLPLGLHHIDTLFLPNFCKMPAIKEPSFLAAISWFILRTLFAAFRTV